jgi:hypothetical protein
LGKNGSGGKKGESGANEPSFGDTELRGFGHGFLFEDGLIKYSGEHSRKCNQ